MGPSLSKSKLWYNQACVGALSGLWVGRFNKEAYLCTSHWRDVDHIDVDHQIEALRLDPSPVLMSQRSI